MVSEDFATQTMPHFTACLVAGEQLCGVIAANRAKTFSGALFAIGVTDRRLLLQQLDRRIQPKGEPHSVPPDNVASARVSGAGDDWLNATTAILDQSALTLRLETTDGEKYKLMFMKGGDGMLGQLGGGESQRQGVAALGDWMRRLTSGT
jgi:hypothetical protein